MFMMINLRTEVGKGQFEQNEGEEEIRDEGIEQE